ncbi:PRC-barrel domain-containing protein [Ilumatobacter sp.]|uniref:PRC-barrel domain-containing protein n=1 Tax=Ilumatobacter sp. TaxID=1967498 RepID=UPI003C5C10B7
MKSMSGQSVVAIDNAEEIGKVKHFVVAPDVARIERLHIDGRKKKALFAEWQDIESFGSDRVMVTAADAASGSDDDRDLDAAKGSIDLIGSRILDTAGFEHGTVADASFDADTGSIVQITSSEGGDVTADRIHSLGSYAVVVDA